jgi:hypothetical protein
MMQAQALIDWLTHNGVTLRLDGNDIVHRGPRRVLRPDVLAKLREHKADVVAQLKRLTSPADIAERAAIIAEGDCCDRTTADNRALAEFGFSSWRALADSLRKHILGHLAALPGAPDETCRRLATGTRAFLESLQWRDTVALGWDLIELFAVNAHNPLVRLDGMGLIPLISLAKRPGARIETIEPVRAVIRTPSGAVQSRCAFLVDVP